MLWETHLQFPLHAVAVWFLLILLEADDDHIPFVSANPEFLLP
jgi:hypothetical protein